VRRRHFATLIESASAEPGRQQAWSPVDAAMVFLPPLIAFSLVALVSGQRLIAFGTGCAVFFLMAYLSPAIRRFRSREPVDAASEGSRVLRQSTGREVFGRALESADRVSETWPELKSLLRADEAEEMLADALWELAGVLVKAERLHGVLVELSRPEFAQRSISDDTAREVEHHRTVTRAALVKLNEEVARRVTSIRRAEEAGTAFIREQEMRRAIRAAEESLRSIREADRTAGVALTASDAGAELAERTKSVLDAYRELTTRYRTDQP
jgi:hypothetical protein